MLLNSTLQFAPLRAKHVQAIGRCRHLRVLWIGYLGTSKNRHSGEKLGREKENKLCQVSISSNYMVEKCFNVSTSKFHFVVAFIIPPSHDKCFRKGIARL